MGAWDHIYRKGERPEAGTPEAYGILAVKEELAANGATGLNMTIARIGNAADTAIRAFQSGHSLTVDGEVGPRTAKALFAKRVHNVQRQYGIADSILCRVASLESDWDPAAVGVADAADLGIVQIHMPAHPTITVEEAFTPSWALRWAAAAIHTAYASLGDWDATIAAWNVGLGGARAWLAAGKPATLFVSWFNDPDGNPLDLGARATTYVKLVRAQSC
jgi:soluble lytic murein transglycosylase-like protein